MNDEKRMFCTTTVSIYLLPSNSDEGTVDVMDWVRVATDSAGWPAFMIASAYSRDKEYL